MYEMTAQSPLAEHSGPNGTRAEFQGVTVSELPILEHFNIRLQPDDRDLVGRLQAEIGFEIPVEPNTFVIHENLLCAWLGPDEWLIVSPPDQSDRVEERLVELFAGRFATMSKLGSAQTIIRTSGPRAVEFLCRGIAIDLDPSRFQFGQCVQTVMAHANIMVLNHTQEEPMLDLIVRRSFADHLWRWLLDVGREAEFRV